MSILLAPLAKYLIGIGGVIAALYALYMKGRLAGAQRERDKQAKRDAKLSHIADQVQNDIGAMPPEEARKELLKWSRKK